MTSVRITVDTDPLTALAGGVRVSPKTLFERYERNSRRLRVALLTELREEPGKPNYPIAWKNDTQQRAVMRKLRLAGQDKTGYIRTHDMVRRWATALTPQGNGGVLSYHNTSPIVEFVQGAYSQPFHVDRWTLAVEGGAVYEYYQRAAEDTLLTSWFAGVDDLMKG